MRAGLLLFIALAALPASGAEPETLHLVTEDIAPINMAGPNVGEVRGIATEVIEKALAEYKIPYTISIESWPRAYDMALHGHNTCVYSTSRSEDRAPLFKWVGPVIRDRWVLFGRIDGPAPASLDDVRGHAIGGHYNGAATLYLKERGFSIDEESDFHASMNRVVARQLDYAVSGLLVGAYAISHDKDLDDIVPVLAFKDSILYLACNKSVPDHVVEQLNASVARMVADGTVAAITRRYQ